MSSFTGQPIFMNLGYTNCSVPGWEGFSRTCLECHFNATEAGFAKAVGRLWTSFAATGDPNLRYDPTVGQVEPHVNNVQWPDFGSRGDNVLLQPQFMLPPKEIQQMQSEHALGREKYCRVWDEIDAIS